MEEELTEKIAESIVEPGREKDTPDDDDQGEGWKVEL